MTPSGPIYTTYSLIGKNMEFKFEIGQTVYCVDDMHRKYPLVIGKRETRFFNYKNDDGTITKSEYNHYSDEKGIGWYMEQSLEK